VVWAIFSAISGDAYNHLKNLALIPQAFNFILRHQEGPVVESDLLKCTVMVVIYVARKSGWRIGFQETKYAAAALKSSPYGGWVDIAQVFARHHCTTHAWPHLGRTVGMVELYGSGQIARFPEEENYYGVGATICAQG